MKRPTLRILALSVLILFVVAVAAYWAHTRHPHVQPASAGLRNEAEVTAEYDELAFASQRKADELHMSNLKLEDHIAELEGRPKRNGLAIVELESKWRYDDLYRDQEQQLTKLLTLYDRDDPDMKRIMSAPTQALLAAISEQRRVNITGDEHEKKEAAKNAKIAREYLIALAEKYKDSLQKTPYTQPSR